MSEDPKEKRYSTMEEILREFFPEEYVKRLKKQQEEEDARREIPARWK